MNSQTLTILIHPRFTGDLEISELLKTDEGQDTLFLAAFMQRHLGGSYQLNDNGQTLDRIGTPTQTVRTPNLYLINPFKNRVVSAIFFVHMGIVNSDERVSLTLDLTDTKGEPRGQLVIEFFPIGDDTKRSLQLSLKSS